MEKYNAKFTYNKRLSLHIHSNLLIQNQQVCADPHPSNHNVRRWLLQLSGTGRYRLLATDQQGRQMGRQTDTSPTYRCLLLEAYSVNEMVMQQTYMYAGWHTMQGNQEYTQSRKDCPKSQSVITKTQPAPVYSMCLFSISLETLLTNIKWP